MKQFSQSIPTLKSVDKCCFSILPRKSNGNLNQDMGILQVDIRERAVDTQFHVRNSSHCPYINGTGRQDLLITSHDNDKSIKFDYATSLAIHVNGHIINC